MFNFFKKKSKNDVKNSTSAKFKVGDILILKSHLELEEFEDPCKAIITAVGKKKYQYKFVFYNKNISNRFRVAEFYVMEELYTLDKN